MANFEEVKAAIGTKALEVAALLQPMVGTLTYRESISGGVTWVVKVLREESDFKLGPDPEVLAAIGTGRSPLVIAHALEALPRLLAYQITSKSTGHGVINSRWKFRLP